LLLCFQLQGYVGSGAVVVVGWVETVEGGAAGPADDHRPFICVVAATHCEEEWTGVLIFVKELGSVAGDESGKDLMSSFPQTPAGVLSQELDAGLESFGKDYGVI